MDAGTQKADKLKLRFDTKHYSEFPDEFSKAINEVEKDFDEKKDPQRIDIIVDKYYYINLLRIARKVNVPLITNYVEGLVEKTT